MTTLFIIYLLFAAFNAIVAIVRAFRNASTATEVVELIASPFAAIVNFAFIVGSFWSWIVIGAFLYCEKKGWC